MDLRMFCRVLGAAALLGAAISTSTPLGLEVVDRTGTRIACGDAFHPVLDTATREDAINRQLRTAFGSAFEASDYASQCNAIIDGRRTIATSVAVVGAMIGGVSFYRRSRRPSHALAPPRHRLQTVKVTRSLKDSGVDVPPRKAADLPAWSDGPLHQGAAAHAAAG